MSKIRRLPTVDELLNISLANILNNIKYNNPNEKGSRAVYFGRFVDLKKDCQRIINAIEQLEEKNG